MTYFASWSTVRELQYRQKKPRLSGAFFAREKRYWLELPEVEPLVPVEPALPELGEVLLEPVSAGAVLLLAVFSRLPWSSASTRRSGCRQAISFWFLLLSLPMRSH